MSDMQLLAYRSLFQQISSNQHLIKSIAILSKITHIQYPEQSIFSHSGKDKDKDRKFRCWVCAKKYGQGHVRNYDQILMLILHIQLIHSDIVQNYQIGSDTIHIKLHANKNSICPLQNKYIETVPLIIQSDFVGKNNKSDDKNSYFVSNKLSVRLKYVTTNIVAKLKKLISKSEQTYYHSTDIFRKIQQESMEEDSEQELGEIERELEKLRIQDFTDVNENDKIFFIQWNNYIQDCKKSHGIIFRHDISKIFINFSQIARNKGIPRINFVMHAWTLWSVGTIQGTDIIKALNQYDTQIQMIPQ